MSKTLEFKAFCFEAYRAEKNLTGRAAMSLFKKYGVLDYLGKCYNVLHTTGREYIIEDIDAFILDAASEFNFAFSAGETVAQIKFAGGNDKNGGNTKVNESGRNCCVNKKRAKLEIESDSKLIKSFQRQFFPLTYVFIRATTPQTKQAKNSEWQFVLFS